MRIAAVFVLAVLSIWPAAAKAASVEELFQQFDLFGSWAADCEQPATRANPHVRITTPSAGLVLEDHDLGPKLFLNRYSVLAATQISATRLSAEVIFRPGTGAEERQKLEFLIHDGTRRTMFNQPAGGAVRVKDGIALARGTETPVLKKCG